MKHALAASAIAMLLSLSAPVAFAAAKTPEQVVKDHVAAANAGNLDALMADYADNAVTVMAEQVIVGKVAIRAGFQQMMAANSGMVVTPVEVTTQGNVGTLKYTTNVGVAGSESFVLDKHGRILVDVPFFNEPAK